MTVFSHATGLTSCRKPKRSVFVWVKHHKTFPRSLELPRYIQVSTLQFIGANVTLYVKDIVEQSLTADLDVKYSCERSGLTKRMLIRIQRPVPSSHGFMSASFPSTPKIGEMLHATFVWIVVVAARYLPQFGDFRANHCDRLYTDALPCPPNRAKMMIKARRKKQCKTARHADFRAGRACKIVSRSVVRVNPPADKDSYKPAPPVGAHRAPSDYVNSVFGIPSQEGKAYIIFALRSQQAHLCDEVATAQRRKDYRNRASKPCRCNLCTFYYLLILCRSSAPRYRFPSFVDTRHLDVFSWFAICVGLAEHGPPI